MRWNGARVVSCHVLGREKAAIPFVIVITIKAFHVALGHCRSVHNERNKAPGKVIPNAGKYRE